MEESQTALLREHEDLSRKYRSEKERLINKELELTEQGTIFDLHLFLY